MADDRQVNVFGGAAQIGEGNTQVINPTTDNNTTNNNTTNNNTTNNDTTNNNTTNNDTTNNNTTNNITTNNNTTNNNTTNNNTTNNNTTNNNTTNSNNQLHVHLHLGNNTSHSNDPQAMPQNIRLDTGQQLPELQQISLQLAEKCMQGMKGLGARQEAMPTEFDASQRSGPQRSECGQLTIPDQSVPTASRSDGESPQHCPPGSPQSMSGQPDHKQQNRKRTRDAGEKEETFKRRKVTDGQSSNKTPGCSESDQMTKVPAEESPSTKQPACTETPDSVQITDISGQVLQSGDCVAFRSDRLQWYYGLYVENLCVIRSDMDTQKVKMEKMDVDTRPFKRLTPTRFGKCKIFTAEGRANRARSYVGRSPPVWETKRGVDFVTWTCSGLNSNQAANLGFDLRWRRP